MGKTKETHTSPVLIFMNWAHMSALRHWILSPENILLNRLQAITWMLE
jgi:hypothetical protein